MCVGLLLTSNALPPSVDWCGASNRMQATGVITRCQDTELCHPNLYLKKQGHSSPMKGVECRNDATVVSQKGAFQQFHEPP